LSTHPLPQGDNQGQRWLIVVEVIGFYDRLIDFRRQSETNLRLAKHRRK